MNGFEAYFKLGWGHILDLHALDHLLFITALIIVYDHKDWKRILLLLTAFTLGHAVAMIIAFTEVIKVSSDWVEFMIPLTIMVTALYHMFSGNKGGRFIYIMTVIFGLIHGMAYAQGFASLFRNGEGYVKAALGFNIGVEIGQLVFAVVLLIGMELLSRFKGLDRNKLRYFLFGVVITLSLQLLIQNWIF
jgi:hypothetical protein